jgi:hypothetical protein
VKDIAKQNTRKMPTHTNSKPKNSQNPLFPSLAETAAHTKNVKKLCLSLSLSNNIKRKSNNSVFHTPAQSFRTRHRERERGTHPETNFKARASTSCSKLFFEKKNKKQQKRRPKNLHRPNGLQSRRDCNQPNKMDAKSAAKLARCFSSNMYKPAANGKNARSPEAKQQARTEAALRLDENDDRMKSSSGIRTSGLRDALSFLFLRSETG